MGGKARALSTSVFSWCFSVLDLVGLCGSLDPVESVVPEGFPVRSGGGRQFGNAPFQEATLGFGPGHQGGMAVREQDLEALIRQCVPIFQRCFTHQCVREVVDELGVARDVTSDDDRGAGSLPGPAVVAQRLH